MAAKYMAPQFLQQYTDAVKGTPLLPRDLLTSIAYNRFAGFILDDGTIYYNMPSRNDVSFSLDSIGAQPGDVLVRGENGWTAVPSESLLPTPIGLCVMNTTSGSYPLSNVWYNAPYLNPVFDPYGWFNPSTQRVEPPEPGIYFVDFRFELAAAAIKAARYLNKGVVQRNVGIDQPDEMNAIAGTFITRAATPGALGISAQFFKPSGTGTVPHNPNAATSYMNVWGPFTPLKT